MIAEDRVWRKENCPGCSIDILGRTVTPDLLGVSQATCAAPLPAPPYPNDAVVHILKRLVSEYVSCLKGAETFFRNERPRLKTYSPSALLTLSNYFSQLVFPSSIL